MKPERKAKRSREAVAGVPAGYGDLLADLKGRIRSAQVKAALSVNRELIALYWHIRESIAGQAEILQQAVAELRGRETVGTILAQAARELGDRNLQQAVGELDGRNLSQPASEVPWGHNVVLCEKLKVRPERPDSNGNCQETM